MLNSLVGRLTDAWAFFVAQKARQLSPFSYPRGAGMSIARANTIKFAPTGPDDAEDIAAFLDGLRGARLQLTTPRSCFIAPVLQSWTVTDAQVCITFSPGVLEIVGREIDPRKLLEALGKRF